MDLKVSVVLPAAGIGERMQGTTPKQFCEVRGKAIIMHTIEAFSRVSWIEHIIVATSAARQGQMIELCQGQDKVKVILGASVRHRSIWNGVKTVGQVQPACDVIVIHDGVRPLIEEDLLLQIVNAAYEHGAAGVVRPLVSTVVASDHEGFLEESLDRCRYKASEMPQSFRYQHIADAYQKCTDYDLDYGTECLHLAMKYAGSKVKLIEGPDYLWKVTHRKDLFALESLLKEKEKYVVCLLGFPRESYHNVTKTVTECLPSSQIKVVSGSSNLADTAIVYLDDPDRQGWITQSNDLICDIPYKCVICIVSGEVFGYHIHAKLRDTVKYLCKAPTRLTYGVIVMENSSEKFIDFLRHLIEEKIPLLSGQILVAD